MVGVLAFAGFWLLLVVFNRRLCPSKPGLPIINFPLLHLSLTYGLLCYFTSGTESPIWENVRGYRDMGIS